MAGKRSISFGELDLEAIGLQEQQRRADAPEPSSNRTVPSTSGARARSFQDHDDPVGAIRELYAQGRADLALELASEIASVLEDAGAEDDGFGGLIPVDDDNAFGVIGEGDFDDGEADEADPTMMPSSADSARLAAMTSNRVPRLLLGPRQISALPMDPRMGFLLGHIDGVQTMEEILDVCAMPEADALAILERLRAMGVIAVD